MSVVGWQLSKISGEYQVVVSSLRNGGASNRPFAA
jgi:hypothetical protein